MAMNNSLAEVHPELVSEWSEKNLPLTPDDITFGSNKKVWWRGACGHEWQTSVKARSNGEKCPICSGARVIAGINDLATLEPLLAKQWSKKNKIKPTEVSIGSHKKVIWRCEKGHEWEAAVKSRTINKTGCPYCSHNKVLAGFNDLATLLPDIAAEWSDRNYPLLPTQVTVFANRKAWWKCKDCGREWNTLISTRSGGSKCPYCSGYIFLKGFNDLQTTHPEIASEWSEKNLPLKPDEVNAKSRKNVWWKCRKCGNEWKSVVNARVKGTVCPVCAEREVLAGYNDLATTDNQLLSEWDYTRTGVSHTPDGILLSDQWAVMATLLEDAKTYKKEHFLFGEGYEHFYFLTNDYHGETLLWLLCHPEIIGQLNAMLLQELQPPCRNAFIENDARTDKEKQNTDPILSEGESVRTKVRDNIELDLLCHNQPESAPVMQEIYELVVETIQLRSPVLRLGNNLFPMALVRERLLQLTSEHIRFVLDGLCNLRTDVKNIKKYLLAMLFNAPVTLSGRTMLDVRKSLGGGFRPMSA